MKVRDWRIGVNSHQYFGFVSPGTQNIVWFLPGLADPLSAGARLRLSILQSSSQKYSR